ncbi:MAG TPA: 4Fe-4S double cluster binding domain-containing protein, partial [Longimicrobiales bacterium]|nr:4Fe-4S double cluster binding domain-containing protein [Longimicrobiales bacterium]
GIGWFGRNTMLIDPERGSYFLLGVVAVDLELPRSEPFEADRCGSCSACLPACPTGALEGRDETGAPILDARKCISYWTIETDAPIPVEIREAMGNRVFGCDICQEACPWNRFAHAEGDPAYAARGPGMPPPGVEALPGEADVVHPGTDAPTLLDLLDTALDPVRWDAFSRGSPIRRAGRSGFARNVCVAIGNWLAELGEPHPAAGGLLTRALEDESPVVREHAAWALDRAGKSTEGGGG